MAPRRSGPRRCRSAPPQTGPAQPPAITTPWRERPTARSGLGVTTAMGRMARAQPIPWRTARRSRLVSSPHGPTSPLAATSAWHSARMARSGLGVTICTARSAMPPPPMPPRPCKSARRQLGMVSPADSNPVWRPGRTARSGHGAETLRDSSAMARSSNAPALCKSAPLQTGRKRSRAAFTSSPPRPTARCGAGATIFTASSAKASMKSPCAAMCPCKSAHRRDGPSSHQDISSAARRGVTARCGPAVTTPAASSVTSDACCCLSARSLALSHRPAAAMATRRRYGPTARSGSSATTATASLASVPAMARSTPRPFNCSPEPNG